MEYEFLGNSGLEVSRLTFGTMTFGGGEWFKNTGNSSQDEADRLIDICMEAGVNTFDTANGYSNGLSEEIVGKSLARKKRSDVIIATKAFYAMGEGKHDRGLSRMHLIKACNDSLRRLKTDYIDLYQLHEIDSHTPLEETLSALETLLQQGKIRYVGCSNFSGWHLMKALSIADKRGYSPIISQQIYYSLLAREAENELVPLSLDQKVGMLIWSPLSFGLLSGKYKRNEPMPENTRLSHMQMPGGWTYDKLYDIVDVLADIAGARGKTIPQVALNWLLRRPTVTSVVIGARNESQLKDNLGACGWVLTHEEVKRLDEVSKPSDVYPYWHQLQWSDDRNPNQATQYKGL